MEYFFKGFSIGAHMCGEMGSRVQNRDDEVGRITGDI